MKNQKFLASIVLAVSLVALAAPVFAQSDHGVDPFTRYKEQQSVVSVTCPHCYRIINGTKAECNAHIARCTGTKSTAIISSY